MLKKPELWVIDSSYEVDLSKYHTLDPTWKNWSTITEHEFSHSRKHMSNLPFFHIQPMIPRTLTACVRYFAREELGTRTRYRLRNLDTDEIIPAEAFA